MIFTVSNISTDKYIYTFTDDNRKNELAKTIAIKEGQWIDKTVISVSVMNSCFIGCKNCPYQNYDLSDHRNLTAEEIVEQVYAVLAHQGIEQDIKERGDWFEVTFGETIGEPLLNWTAVKQAMAQLHTAFPRVQFTIRTIAPNFQKPYLELIELYKTIPEITLQFIVNSTEEKQKANIIFKTKMPLIHIRDLATSFYVYNKRRSQIYYQVDNQDSQATADNLKNLFSPIIFDIVLSSSDTHFDKYFANEGYEISYAE